tara:strand:+ start:39 stop:2009 length:1971 start_codon:yes stop_codon:yes gene_type:complete
MATNEFGIDPDLFTTGKFSPKQEYIDAARAKALEEGKKYVGDATAFEKFKDALYDIPDATIALISGSSETLSELALGLAKATLQGAQMATTTDPKRVEEIRKEPGFTSYFDQLNFPRSNIHDSKISGVTPTDVAEWTGKYIAPVPIGGIAAAGAKAFPVIAKGAVKAADEFGTAARHFPEYTPFKNIEPKSVGAMSIDDLIKSGPIKKPNQKFKPAADDIIKNNYYSMKNEDIANILLSDPDKFFYSMPRTTDYASERMVKSIGNRAKTLGIEMKGGNKAAALRYGSENNYQNTLEKFNEKIKTGDINTESKKDLYETFSNSYEQATGKKPVSTGVGSKPFLRILDRYNKENDIFIPRKSAIRKEELEKTRAQFGTSKSEDLFRMYYKDNYQNILKKENLKSSNLADIGTKSLSFRYLNFIRKTETPNLQKDFKSFSAKYDPNTLNTPGTKLYEDFQRFKIIDDARIEANSLLKDVLKKIFPADKGKKSKASLQLAHKFESSGIAKGYVDPSKQGKGGDPFEIYLDVSQYNSIYQQKMEKLARKAVKGYMENGNKSDLNKILSYHDLMKSTGVEGQAYPFILGKPKPIDLKISELIQKAMDKGIKFTDQELAKAEEAANYLATSKQKYVKEFSEAANYASGGLVGINQLIRPLRNF